MVENLTDQDAIQETREPSITINGGNNVILVYIRAPVTVYTPAGEKDLLNAKPAATYDHS